GIVKVARYRCCGLVVYRPVRRDDTTDPLAKEGSVEAFGPLALQETACCRLTCREEHQGGTGAQVPKVIERDPLGEHDIWGGDTVRDGMCSKVHDVAARQRQKEGTIRCGGIAVHMRFEALLEIGGLRGDKREVGKACVSIGFLGEHVYPSG